MPRLTSNKETIMYVVLYRMRGRTEEIRRFTSLKSAKAFVARYANSHAVKEIALFKDTSYELIET